MKPKDKLKFFCFLLSNVSFNLFPFLLFSLTMEIFKIAQIIEKKV